MLKITRINVFYKKLVRSFIFSAKKSEERKRLYVEDCFSQIDKDIKAEVRHEEIHKKMSRFMSTKELLNELSELSKARFFAYKIDINVNNRSYKTWEQISII